MRERNTIELKGLTAEREDKIVVMPFCQQDVEMHDHDFFELAYITGGSALHTISDADGEVRSGEVKAGDYFIIDYGSRHSYRECRDFTLINCLFLPEMIDDTLADCRSFEEVLRVSLIRYYKWCFGQPSANRVFHDEEGSILPLILGIQEEYQEKKVGYTEVFRCRLTEILILTIRKIVCDSKKDDRERQPRSTAVLEAIRYLDKNYRERAVLKQFCREYHYSQQYISRKFRQETEMTALEYLQTIRIEKCCELLAGSDLCIQEAARSVGYEDVKFFCTLFKRTLNMTPGEYRKTAAAAIQY